MIHFAAGSIEFWWRFGGVGGDDNEDTDDPEDRLGDDGGGVSTMVASGGGVTMTGERGRDVRRKDPRKSRG